MPILNLLNFTPSFLITGKTTSNVFPVIFRCSSADAYVELDCKIIKNPVLETIQIKCGSELNNYNLAILMNTQGQIVANWQYPGLIDGNLSLKISHLADGEYELYLFVENRTFKGKVIKQNR